MSTETTYTVVHVVEGEPSTTLYQVTKDQLTDPIWVCKNIFNLGDSFDEQDLHIAKKVVCNPVFCDTYLNMHIFEGDAGYVFIFKTGLTKHYETISL